MFAFAFEGTLFEFEYTRPHFEPLFAFPLNKTPLEAANLNTFIIYSAAYSKKYLLPWLLSVALRGKASLFLISCNT